MAASDWSERTRLLITIGVVAVINIGIWGFAYKVRGNWQIEEKKLNGIRIEISNLNAQIAKKPDLEQKRNTLKRESDTKEKKLPNEHFRDKFMLQLAEIAQQTNLDPVGQTVSNINLPVTVPGIDNPQNFARDLWKTRYKGDFKSICTFLNKLEEHYQYFVSIENLDIRTTNNGMNVTGFKHDVGFDIETYRYVPDK